MPAPAAKAVPRPGEVWLMRDWRPTDTEAPIIVKMVWSASHETLAVQRQDEDYARIYAVDLADDLSYFFCRVAVPS